MTATFAGTRTAKRSLEGFLPAVAPTANLVHMLEAHDDPVRDQHVLKTMRRVLELERSLAIER